MLESDGVGLISRVIIIEDDFSTIGSVAYQIIAIVNVVLDVAGSVVASVFKSVTIQGLYNQSLASGLVNVGYGGFSILSNKIGCHYQLGRGKILYLPFRQFLMGLRINQRKCKRCLWVVILLAIILRKLIFILTNLFLNIINTSIKNWHLILPNNFTILINQRYFIRAITLRSLLIIAQKYLIIS